MRLLGRLIEWAALGFMWLLLPLSPLVASAIAGDMRYVRQWGTSFRQSARSLRSMARANVIARRIAGYSPSTARERAGWQIAGECSHCGNCCLDRSCVFLDYDSHGHSRCGIYGNWFFRRLTCGGYPITPEDIRIYDCPSFRAHPRDHLGGGLRGADGRLAGRVIPIVARTAEPVAGRVSGQTTRLR